MYDKHCGNALTSSMSFYKYQSAIGDGKEKEILT